MSLVKNIKITHVKAPIAAAANTDVVSGRLDMSGFDGVMFVLPIDDSVATGVATLRAIGNTTDADGGTDITGASATKTCTVNDDLNSGVLVVDVCQPVKRYLQCGIKSETANIAYGDCIAIQYGAACKPTTQAASVLAATAVASA